MIEITKVQEEDIFVLNVIGDVDASSSIELDSAISSSLEEGYRKIMVDCKSLNYISSAGLGVFMSYIEEFENVNAPQAGPRKYAGRPFRMPGISLGIHSVAALGEHNQEILRDIAGLSQEEISVLTVDGIISNQPLPTESRP